MHGTVLLCYFICVFCDFYSDGIPVPMVTDTRQEVFAWNNAAVSGGQLPQPLFEAISIMTFVLSHKDAELVVIAIANEQYVQ